MEQQNTDSLKGQFLISMPGLLDPNFFQTVTCISEHTAQGAVGIVINRVHSLVSMKDIFEELDLPFKQGADSIPVHIGGPVHSDELFILHGPPFGWEGCFVINPSLGMSNTVDILEAIAKGRGPESFIVALGCAGWGPDQLETEIKQNAWLTGPIFPDIIFNVPFEGRWEASMKRLGVDPHLLSNVAGHA